MVGEGLQQGDLLFAEGLHVGAAKQDRSDALFLAQQGHAQDGANATMETRDPRQFTAVGELGAFVREKIAHMHRSLIQERTPGSPVTVDRPPLGVDRYPAVVRAKAQVVAIFQEHDGIIGLAKLAGTLDNGVENRPDVGRRGGDHPEDVAATGLVGQSLLQLAGLGLNLVEQTDVLDRDHGLVGEGLN